MNYKDALGNNLTIGSTYAYTTSSNGINTVTKGTLTNISKTGRARLTDCVYQSDYGNLVVRNNSWEDFSDVSVYTCKIFAVCGHW